MSQFDEFRAQVADAYEHLYDLVYLRTHPLVHLLITRTDLNRKDSAWELHHLLLNVIQELDPGPQAPVFSREWRRHRLMVLRYVDGLSPQTIADQLAISRRHYYRGHEMGIDAVTDILWQRYVKTEAVPPDAGSVNRLELMRLEAAKLLQTERYAHLHDVLNGVLSLLQDEIKHHQLQVERHLPSLSVAVDKRLLRQLLLAALGHLIEAAHGGTLHITGEINDNTLLLRLSLDQHFQPENLDALHEISHLLNITTRLIQDRGFEMQMPVNPQRTVLAIDDNEDTLTLFERILGLHNYRVVKASRAQDALSLAPQIQPYAIVLDLMMPEQDGWDLLQIFLNQPDTRTIPIVVCSILRQKDLALALGAAAFLEKPFNEESLLKVLAELET